MKLVLSLLALVSAAIIAPAAVAGQQGGEMGWGQKARPDPVVIQAATAGATATPQPDFILTGCGETESTGDPSSAFHAVDPAGMLSNFMQGKYDRPVEFSAIKNVTLLQGTQHGKITSVIDNTGRSWYAYDPIPNYVGNDRAVFLAQFEGKVYKIVLNLVVSLQVNENPLTDEQTPVCPEPTLIKVSKPSSGASGYSSGYDLSSVSITFADLAGAAIGQTNTNGITLDTNASGYGWFIDTTPGLNEEYLPTSNPNEWVAKAGSAAAGKMDMLSRKARGQVLPFAFSSYNSGAFGLHYSRVSRIIAGQRKAKES